MSDLDYLGIARADVLASLQAAEKFVSTLNLGPATDAYMQEWLAKKPYEAIKAAQTRDALFAAMNDTGTKIQFGRMHELFFMHAAIDGENSPAYAAYRDLKAWSGFSNHDEHEQGAATRAEFDAHITTQLSPYFIGTDGAARIAAYEAAIPTYERAYQAYHLQILKTLKTAQEDIAKAGSLTNYFNALDVDARHYFKEAVKSASGLRNQFQSLNELPHAYLRYTLLQKNAAPSYNFTDAVKAYDVIRDEFEAIIERFLQTSEAPLSGVGHLTGQSSPVGLIFTATRPVAQAMADAFPGYDVIDHYGRVVPPQPKAGGQGALKP